MGSSHIYYNCVNFLQKGLQKAFLSISKSQDEPLHRALIQSKNSFSKYGKI